VLVALLVLVLLVLLVALPPPPKLLRPCQRGRRHSNEVSLQSLNEL
jgi:hypothetical protein